MARGKGQEAGRRRRRRRRRKKGKRCDVLMKLVALVPLVAKETTVVTVAY